METIIHYVAAAIMLFYGGIAVFVTCRRRTPQSIILCVVGFVAGGVALYFFAEAVSSVICWTVVICLVLAILGLLA